MDSTGLQSLVELLSRLEDSLRHRLKVVLPAPHTPHTHTHEINLYVLYISLELSDHSWKREGLLSVMATILAPWLGLFDQRDLAVCTMCERTGITASELLSTTHN